MGKTPYLAAKSENASACLELLRGENGRPTPEEESFDLTRPTAAVILKGGTIQVDGDAVAFSVKEEKETGVGAGTAAPNASPAPAS